MRGKFWKRWMHRLMKALDEKDNPIAGVAGLKEKLTAGKDEVDEYLGGRNGGDISGGFRLGYNKVVDEDETLRGRHRLAALQQLEKKGLLHKLEGMDRGMITVHIVNVTCSMDVNYGALRGHQIQSNWVAFSSRTHLHNGR